MSFYYKEIGWKSTETTYLHTFFTTRWRTNILGLNDKDTTHLRTCIFLIFCLSATTLSPSHFIIDLGLAVLHRRD
jgi:hypothetical protein